MARRMLFILLVAILPGCDGEESSPASSLEAITIVQPPPSIPAAQPEIVPRATWQSLIEVGAPSDTAPVVAGAALSATEVHPGDTIEIASRLRIAPGWHIYDLGYTAGPSQPTSIDLGLPKGIGIKGPWAGPTPSSQVTPMGLVNVFQSEATFTRRLTVSKAAKVGAHEITCTLHYQACDHSRCLRPDTIKITVPITVIASQEGL